MPRSLVTKMTALKRAGLQIYTPDVDVPPVVVTLSEKKAEEVLGDPTERRGFTTEGTVEEWTVIADCYFETLAEE